MDLISRIEQLERRLRRLVELYRHSQRELAQIQQEKASLEELVARQKRELSNFQNQPKISKIVTSVPVNPQDTAELRQRIDECVKEIDQCIAYLSNSEF
ncbi:hypothetical protein SAMN05421823_102654 [Catalinimonas alkaloidigena]|uniref:Uncharacterized protein n=1 Tax=Catalinimonas alkaloidigena TaxID=1075417 RepID=A0A1G9BLI0_9BACT|nr:hypothetical protein [Catalinimonas alkaloidigena]SDK40388.1 hypothetical protein SAMN05421823_102654 [Catalinimonas alkaloidigena]